MGSAERQSALWGVAPRDWAELQEPACRPLWRDTLAALGAGPGFRLLDAGCGGGGAAIEAATLGCEVTGVDACPALLAIARERLPQGRFLAADLEELPFPADAFDGALATNSVIFAENIPQALRELARVVRVGGRVAISSWGRPEECDMRAVFAALAGVLPARPPGGGPFAWSGAGALAGLLREAGFTIVTEGGSQCDFHYPDFGLCWRAQSAAGNYQAMLAVVGVERLKPAVADAIRPFIHPDGSITLRNVYRWAVGERTGP